MIKVSQRTEGDVNVLDSKASCARDNGSACGDCVQAVFKDGVCEHVPGARPLISRTQVDKEL